MATTPNRTNGTAHARPDASAIDPTAPPKSRFELAPPRHFLYPALLLLLAEEPRHGYRLVDSLLRLGFGPVDRAAVYRALADLEADGYLESWEMEPPAGGSTRNIYGVTDTGVETLRRWMAIIAEESHCLTRVLTRFTVLTAATNGRHAGSGCPDDNRRTPTSSNHQGG
ncbi:MAG TPA: helix-turn-helix transcriptional regulator [Acidimicrobiales bacterium]|nr:helix-turn-helix transcriptional regulator [Acidimicrobiales bacterium]